MAFDVSILLRLIDRLTGPAKTAGASYNNLGNQVAATSKRISATSAQSVSSLNRVSTAANTASASIGRLATSMRNMRTLSSGFGGIGLGGGGGAMMAAFPLAHMLKSAANYEDKLLDIQKVWQGTDEDYDRMIKKLRRLNTEIPLTRAEIATLLEEGVKSGISKDVDELGEFTLKAAQFATAFQLPNVEEAAQKLAKIKGSLGLSMDEFTSMADSMNTVAANFATTEADLLDIVRRVGGLSKAIGGEKGLADLMVIGGAQTAAGVKREVAATGLRSLLARLSTQPKDTKEGLKELGLNPKDVAKRLPNDMFGTTLDILQRIAEAPVERQAGLLSKIAGMRTFDAFAPLLGNMELMEKLRKVYDDPFRLTMAAEYERRITGINSALQITSNVLGEVSDSVVMAWKPQITEFLDKLRGFASGMGDSKVLQWTAALFTGLAALSLIALPFGILGASIFSVVLGFKALFSVFGAGMIVLRPLLGLLGGIAGGILGGAAAFGRITSLAFRFAGALGAATIAFRALRKALLLGLVIEGLVELYQNWDKLKALFADPLKVDVIFPDAPEWLKFLMQKTAQAGNWIWDGLSDPTGETASKKVNGWLPDLSGWWNGSSRGEGDQLGMPQAFPKEAFAGIPAAVAQDIGRQSDMKAPPGITAAVQGTSVTFHQAPPSISVSVTVNATTNADPNAIGAAAANAVGSKVRGALSDAPHSAP